MLTHHAWKSVLLCIVFLAGCTDRPKETSKQRYDAARSLFEQTTRLYHLPAAEAQGAAREKLLAQAAQGYSRLVRKYGWAETEGPVAQICNRQGIANSLLHGETTCPQPCRLRSAGQNCPPLSRHAGSETGVPMRGTPLSEPARCRWIQRPCTGGAP